MSSLGAGPALIVDLSAAEILDSRGFPTLAVVLALDNGICARAAVPSGASTGAHEAHELRDGDPGRYLGKGVLKAVGAVNGALRDALLGTEIGDQARLDTAMARLDGTPNKSRLGANAVLGVSLAAARARAASAGVPLYQSLWSEKSAMLPVPLMNIVNGGAHADNRLDIQEFMIVPWGAPNFTEALRMGAEIFHCLRQGLRDSGHSTAVGDEGGFAPDFRGAEEAIARILEAIERAGYQPGPDCALALDVAASELVEDGGYRFAGEGTIRDREGMVALYADLCRQYPLISIEDGLGEDDWEGWKALTAELGDRCQLVGDDLFVTAAARVRRGIKEKAGNAVLVKVNQVGSLSETLETCETAISAGFGAVVSHRSGETEDDFIADLAVALECGQIKTGSLCRSERLSKYNRLLDIERELGANAVYAGRSPFRNFPGIGFS